LHGAIVALYNGSMARSTAARPTSAQLDEITDAVLLASRVLVAVAARSLVSVENEVTLPQFRALVVLASRGPVNSSELAEELSVHPSTATRLCDRLVAKGLVTRATAPDSRREVVLTISPEGQAIVDTVTADRRRDIAAIVRRVPSELRPAMVDALQAFADAAGEVPDQSWSAGWGKS
jgi:DNA-binding MarR family transcriptional regulator